MKQKKAAYIWLTANVLGMGAYLFLASAFWVVQEDQGIPGGPGDAFAWFFTVLPVLLLFVAVNLVALIRVAIEYYRDRGLVPVLLWILVCSVWLNVLLFDHIKSVRYIDSKYIQPNAPADAPKAARH